MTQEPRSIFSDPTEEEKLYFGMIDRAVDSKDERIISNGRPAHAVYIIYKFLECAVRSINIYTGSLRRVFDGVMAYGEPKLAESALGFLQRGGRLNIVIGDEPDIDPDQSIKDHPLLKSLINANIGSGELTVYHLQDTLTGTQDYHFIVMDDESVRLEVNTEQAQAYVQLQDSELCPLLNGRFRRRVRLSGDPLISLPAT